MFSAIKRFLSNSYQTILLLLLVLASVAYDYKSRSHLKHEYQTYLNSEKENLRGLEYQLSEIINELKANSEYLKDLSDSTILFLNLYPETVERLVAKCQYNNDEAKKILRHLDEWYTSENADYLENVKQTGN